MIEMLISGMDLLKREFLEWIGQIEYYEEIGQNAKMFGREWLKC